MLQEIAQKLQETVGVVENKYSELLKRQATLDGKEANLVAREDSAVKKEAELQTREAAVSGIEDIVTYKKEAVDLATKTSAEISTLAEDKLKFNKTISERLAQANSIEKANETENKRLAQVKAELDAERVQLNIDKENYKEDVVRGLAKNIADTAKK